MTDTKESRRLHLIHCKEGCSEYGGHPCQCPPGNWCGDVLFSGGTCFVCQLHLPHDHTPIGKYAGAVVPR